VNHFRVELYCQGSIAQSGEQWSVKREVVGSTSGAGM